MSTTSTTHRPPLLAFGLNWIEGAPMARVLAAAPLVPATRPCPPQFPYGALRSVAAPRDAHAAYAPSRIVAMSFCEP
ncbi:hypothetical protein, partial [Roseisolibacter sp. H3M3-2]|uniref:hypothetical protein n=1 Tax=Roseisolibacter sp. H3M3-2 TaxID=3031323 RepID=UPI0023DCC7DD